MKYCAKCGKEFTDDAKFCYSCGESVDSLGITDNASKTTNENVSSINTIEGVGIALMIIGLFLGILAGFYLLGHGSALGYTMWDYLYGGVKETGIWIAIIAAASLLIGFFMLASSDNSSKK